MTPDTLEGRLRDLGTGLDVPRAPDIVPAVIARLPHRRDSSPRRAGQMVAIALAVALLLAGAALAVPSTRNAILRALGLRGVGVVRVQQLPAIAPGTASSLRLGAPVPLARARHAAAFTALLPPAPARAYLAHDLPGGRISFLVGPVLIIEFRGSGTPFLFKMIGPGTTLTRVRIGTGTGVYLSGSPHLVFFRTQTGAVQGDVVRLAGNVLIWQEGPVTLRMEGTRTLAQAVRLALSLH